MATCRPSRDRPFSLPDDALPGHILISPDGRRLVAWVSPNAGPSFLDGFRIRADGTLDAAPGSPFAAQRIGPFGSTFSPIDDDRLFVSDAHDGPGAGSVSVYDVAANGGLTPISGSPFTDNQTAPCWVAISPDGRALFAVNTAIPSISSFAVAGTGHCTLTGSTPFSKPNGLRPFNTQVSPNSDDLYVVDAGAAAVSAFEVQRDVADESRR